MGAIDTTSNAVYDIITSSYTISDDQYISNIALVSNISGSPEQPCVIILYNVLCTDGLKFITKDDNDNNLATTFTAFGAPETPDIVPYEIRYPKTAITGASFNVQGTPIIDDGGKVALSFNDTVAPVAPLTGFIVTVNGVIDIVTAATTGINDPTTIALTLTTAPTSGQTVLVSYVAPVLAASQVTATDGGALTSFASMTVTNN